MNGSDDTLPALPARPDDAHKGTFGSVVVVGGSATMIGAPCLVAGAALRAGCGLATLAVDARILQSCLVLEPSAIGVALGDGDAAPFVAGLAPGAVVAFGPGAGREPSAAELARLLWRAPNRLIVDGDGLTLLAALGHDAGRRGAATVLTPHPLEARRLVAAMGITADPLDPGSRTAAAEALATAYGAVVVLKGRHTVISDGRATALNRTGNPALAIPGSGDALTGVIAGLMAQGLDAYPAARLAAHLHGLAGDLWRERHGPVGLVARDLIALLPAAWSRHAATAGGAR